MSNIRVPRVKIRARSRRFIASQSVRPQSQLQMFIFVRSFAKEVTRFEVGLRPLAPLLSLSASFTAAVYYRIYKDDI
jgi:hypothetical protein